MIRVYEVAFLLYLHGYAAAGPSHDPRWLRGSEALTACKAGWGLSWVHNADFTTEVEQLGRLRQCAYGADRDAH